MKKHRVLISPANSKLIEKLNSLGIDTVHTRPALSLRSNERLHADMQVLRLLNTFYLTQESEYIVSYIKDSFRTNIVIIGEALCSEYPHNVLLNCAKIGNKLFCKADVLPEYVKEFCDANDIETVNVNQGYAKCSTLILNNTAIITADSSIEKAAKNNEIDCLRICSGGIHLDEADYGFIGGASGVIGDTVYFFGDIGTHKDKKIITEFISAHGMRYCNLLKDTELCDVGGFIDLSK